MPYDCQRPARRLRAIGSRRLRRQPVDGNSDWARSRHFGRRGVAGAAGRGGAWWLATAGGAARLWRDRAAVPAGWPRGQIFRIFLDSRGNVWMSTSSRRGNQLLMGNPARQTVTDLTHEPGLPDLAADLASS